MNSANRPMALGRKRSRRRFEIERPVTVTHPFTRMRRTVRRLQLPLDVRGGPRCCRPFRSLNPSQLGSSAPHRSAIFELAPRRLSALHASAGFSLAPGVLWELCYRAQSTPFAANSRSCLLGHFPNPRAPFKRRSIAKSRCHLWSSRDRRACDCVVS
jgi:hypothetical protein